MSLARSPGPMSVGHDGPSRPIITDKATVTATEPCNPTENSISFSQTESCMIVYVHIDQLPIDGDDLTNDPLFLDEADLSENDNGFRLYLFWRETVEGIRGYTDGSFLPEIQDFCSRLLAQCPQAGCFMFHNN